MMKFSIFAGDITDAQADALCTSTNPNLTLAMGTGGSLRDHGGHEILRACETIVEEEFRATKRRGLPPGSAHVTTAGALPAKVAIHCVASDGTHNTTTGIIRSCVINALRCADQSGCHSVAMPVFGTGHARFDFNAALVLILETLRDTPTSVDEIALVVSDAERAEIARGFVERVFPGSRPQVEISDRGYAPPPSLWSDDW